MSVVKLEASTEVSSDDYKEFEGLWDEMEGFATYDIDEMIEWIRKNREWDEAKQISFMRYFLIKGLNEKWIVCDITHELLIDSAAGR